jgi:hypothetical protein
MVKSIKHIKKILATQLFSECRDENTSQGGFHTSYHPQHENKIKILKY